MGTFKCNQHLAVIMSQQQQRQRRHTTVSVWKKNQALNNNGNCSEQTITLILSIKTTTAAGARKQLAVRVLFPCVDVETELASERKGKHILVVVCKHFKKTIIRSFLLGSSAEGRLRAGTATKPTTTA